MTLYQPFAATPDYENNFSATPAGDEGTTITCNASANTKGSYSELITATNYDAYAFWLRISNVRAAGANSRTLLDIATGAAGSEQVILPNLMIGAVSTGTYGYTADYYVPLHIPAGVRIAARAQSAAGGKTFQVAIIVFSGKSGVLPSFTMVDAYGPDTTTSGGVSHTAGNTGAESAWASVGGTASRAYKAILPVVASGSVTAYNAIQYHFEWGYNSGSPTFIETHYLIDTGEAGRGWPGIPVLASIASGTQIQVRGEASGTAQALDTAWYGFY